MTSSAVDRRWALLTDPAAERRFRRHDADHLRRSLRTLLIAVTAAILLVFLLTSGTRFSNVPDALASAAQILATVVGVVFAVLLRRPWGPEPLERLGVGLVLLFTTITVVVSATSNDVTFAQPFMIVFGTMLIYLHVPIALRTVTGLALLFSAATFAAWLLGGGEPVAGNLSFVLVVVALIHVTGFVGARRMQLERRQLFAQAETLTALSSSDLLTGLANRRSFEAGLAASWDRARAERAPLSLLMIDVDHFKEVNDLAGHAAGDECLRRLAHAIGAALAGGHGTVTRYGGEEFACLLDGADAYDAYIVARMVHAQVSGARIPRTGSSGHLTISIGIGTVTPEMNDPVELVELADRRLYRAKALGRDRVEPDLVSEPETDRAPRADHVEGHDPQHEANRQSGHDRVLTTGGSPAAPDAEDRFADGHAAGFVPRFEGRSGRPPLPGSDWLPEQAGPLNGEGDALWPRVTGSEAPRYR